MGSHDSEEPHVAVALVGARQIPNRSQESPIKFLNCKIFVLQAELNTVPEPNRITNPSKKLENPTFEYIRTELYRNLKKGTILIIF